ncbi:MAG: hypothetical protein GXY55_14730 [Phycisphaerae bacterium]|nr:hypothetical protein [Phycisphaerae bacterium]
MLKNLVVNDDGSVKPAFTYTILVVSVLVAGFLAYRIWTAGDAVNERTMMCITPGCDYTRDRALQLGETLPALCPKCGKKSVVATFKCPHCGQPNVWNEDRGLKPPTKCTKCGKERWHG